MKAGLTGFENAITKLRKHQVAIVGNITKTKREVVAAVLKDLVKYSPQWSGNLASQWYIEFHGSTGSYAPIANYDSNTWQSNKSPYKMGDNPAVSLTVQRELAKLDSLRWNSKVSIYNYAPYAKEVLEEQKSVNGKSLRPVNQYAAYGAVGVVAAVVVKFNELKNLKRVLK